MARLYADEDVDIRVVVFLRQFGHDVLTVEDAGRRQSPDDQVLADANSDGRIALTFNRRHFIKLHRLDPNHAGIISCTRDDDLFALASRINAALMGDLSGLHIRINKPPKP